MERAMDKPTVNYIRCKKFDVISEANSLLTLKAEFITMIRCDDTKNVSKAMSDIALFMGEKINFVKASDDSNKQRCFYCGSLNNKDINMCTQCGAAL